jgi:hypothetical protein
MTCNLSYNVVVILVSVVGCLYLNLDHVTSVFSLPFDQQHSSNNLQHPVHSHISILSPNQHHYFTLNYFRIIFWTIKLRKQLYKI